MLPWITGSLWARCPLINLALLFFQMRLIQQLVCGSEFGEGMCLQFDLVNVKYFSQLVDFSGGDVSESEALEEVTKGIKEELRGVFRGLEQRIPGKNACTF